MWLTSERQVLSSNARILSAIKYATDASIYPPENMATELTTAQAIIISFMYAFKHKDSQLIETLVEASSTVPQINSSFLSVWLRDDFRFPRGDVVACLSNLGELLIDGLQIPWAVVATLASLDVKYRVQECFLEADDMAGQLLLSSMNPFISEGTQAGCDKEKLVNDKALMIETENGLETTQINAQWPLLGVQPLPREKLVNDQALMIETENGLETTPINAQWPLLGVQPLPREKLVNDQALKIEAENGLETTPINAQWPILGVQPLPRENLVNDQALMIEAENGLETTPINDQWSLLGVHPLPRVSLSKASQTNLTKHVSFKLNVEKISTGTQVELFVRDCGVSAKPEQSTAAVQTIPEVVPSSSNASALSMEQTARVIPSSSKPSTLSMDQPARVKPSSSSMASTMSMGRTTRVKPSSSKASTLSLERTVRVKDETKARSNKIGSFSNMDWTISKGMANELLYRAIQNNDTKSMVTAINAGADVNDEGVMKKRPLHVASSAGRIEPAIELIHWGADLNSLDHWGETPLFVASVAGHLLMAEVLVAAGADIHHKNSDGNSPLHVAAIAGQVEVVRLLLGNGAAASCRGQWSRTPLHFAASGGHLTVVGLLLDMGADPTAVDESGHTPFSLAKSQQQTLVSEFLLYRSRQ